MSFNLNPTKNDDSVWCVTKFYEMLKAHKMLDTFILMISQKDEK